MSRTREDGYTVVKHKDKLSDHIDKKIDNWSIASGNKLKASMRNKMKKIFVGILDALDNEKHRGNLTKETFGCLRSKVLGLGNDQIRCMEQEIDERYNIEALNYYVEFRNPLIEEGTEDERG